MTSQDLQIVPPCSHKQINQISIIMINSLTTEKSKFILIINLKNRPTALKMMIQMQSKSQETASDKRLLSSRKIKIKLVNLKNLKQSKKLRNQSSRKMKINRVEMTNPKYKSWSKLMQKWTRKRKQMAPNPQASYFSNLACYQNCLMMIQ